MKSIEHSEAEVVVRCENGEAFRGDVLLGADGTHSFVRKEMRKLIEMRDGKNLEQEKKSKFNRMLRGSRTRCCWRISASKGAQC